MKRLGFNLTFGDASSKCASLTTGVQDDGTYEFYFHLLGGSGAERHLHCYAEVKDDGLILSGGARLKDNVAKHIGPGIELSHSTQEIARFRAETDAPGPRCKLIQCIDDAWVGTAESTMGGDLTRRSVMLPESQDASGAEYSLAMFDASTSAPSDSTSSVVLPFSAPLPFGLSVTVLQRW